MRPGVVFVLLFSVLMSVYLLLADTMGSGLTFLLQAALVLVVLAAATRVRRTQSTGHETAQDDAGDDRALAPAAAQQDGPATGPVATETGTRPSQAP